MCLAVPGKIISIDENNPKLIMAKVNFAGVTKDICIQWIDEPKVGEYILAHVGFALNRIDEEDAEETIKLLKEMGDI